MESSLHFWWFSVPTCADLYLPQQYLSGHLGGDDDGFLDSLVLGDGWEHLFSLVSLGDGSTWHLEEASCSWPTPLVWSSLLSMKTIASS